MKPSPLPFRTEVRALSAQQLGRVNAERRRQGEAPYPSAEEVLAELGALFAEGGAPLREAIGKWGVHPDERVSLAVLGQPSLVTVDITLPTRLYERAVRERQAEGHLWTPVLDALDISHNWPQVERQLDWNTPASRVVAPGRPHVLVAELGPWIERQTSVDELLALTRFRSYPLLTLLARFAPVLDRRLLEALRPHPGAWASVIARPLPDALVPDVWRAGEKLVQEGPLEADFFNGLQTFRTLEERGHGMPAPVARTLLAELDKKSEVPQGYEERVRENLQRAYEGYLVGRDDWGTEELERLFHFARRGRNAEERGARWRLLARSPSAGPREWLRLLETSRGRHLRQEIASLPAAVANPEVRAVLARSRDARVMASLLPSSTPADFQRNFPRVASVEPMAAAWALERATGEQLAGLPRASLAPLLASERVEVRLAAIRVLGTGASEPPASELSSLTR